MRGELSDIMMMTSPEIDRKCITGIKKGETVLCIKSLKSIYGIMKALLLFYKKFFGDLTSIVFKLNNYDPCDAKI